jgi:LacI family transcriptional regulator
MTTIERAVGALLADGALVARDRKGTFVAGRIVAKETPPITASRETTHIGIILPDGFDPNEMSPPDQWLAPIVCALKDATAANESQATFVSLEPDGEARTTLTAAIQSLLERGVDVVIYVASNEAEMSSRTLQSAAAGLLPVVFVVAQEHCLPCSSVTYGSRDAGYQATRHLLEQGCQSILFFAAIRMEYVELRLSGAREAIRRSGCLEAELSDAIKGHAVHDTDLYVKRIDLAEQSSRVEQMNALHDIERTAYSWATEVIKSGATFDGVVAANDSQAIGFIRAASEQGLRVGVDYAIVGFDDTLAAAAYDLTSMHPPLRELGHEAVRLAFDMARDSGHRQMSCLHSQMIVRSSSHLATRRLGDANGLSTSSQTDFKGKSL